MGGLEHSCEHCNERVEEKWQVRYPRCGDGQNPPEEGHQGRQKGDLREISHGEGEAGQDHRQGLPRESPQGRVLRASRSVASPTKRLRVCSSVSSSCSSSVPPSLRGIFVSFRPGWLEGAWSCMAFRSHDARRGRPHVLHTCLAES